MSYKSVRNGEEPRFTSNPSTKIMNGLISLYPRLRLAIIALLISSANIVSAHSDHEELKMVRASAMYEYTNGLMVTWTALPPDKTPTGVVYSVLMDMTRYHAHHAETPFWSLVNIGLQGINHDTEISAIAGLGTNDTIELGYLSGGSLKWVKLVPPFKIFKTGVDGSTQNTNLAEVRYIRSSAKLLSFTVNFKDRKIASPIVWEDTHSLGHDNIPPPFPAGSSNP
ncbi:hypothetical protein [Synoicihabitans lomoniglobus]|uniref:Uncharacterized protein n=1 Tax=Synoicihabitans lomoniglobus TaxID=2909285 RepID=A0AAE9ZX81_9BACT|nr:hypothetical protein [Opitutaceae bacterium LMO-M01]WED64570.1 hypothetical protein PXH66_19690 [Opitutaceae bacterium LMO-M01]